MFFYMQNSTVVEIKNWRGSIFVDLVGKVFWKTVKLSGHNQFNKLELKKKLQLQRELALYIDEVYFITVCTLGHAGY